MAETLEAGQSRNENELEDGEIDDLEEGEICDGLFETVAHSIPDEKEEKHGKARARSTSYNNQKYEDFTNKQKKVPPNTKGFRNRVQKNTYIYRKYKKNTRTRNSFKRSFLNKRRDDVNASTRDERSGRKNGDCIL